MSRSPAPREAYHHGNLRAEATRAALSILEVEGEAAVTLRRVAGAARVTHGALARPFGDRDGLLDVLADEGMSALGEAVAEAREAEAFVRAYLGFALARPRLYDLAMRRARAAPSASARLIAAAREALGGNDDGIKRVWMTLHGGLTLRAAGALAPQDDEGFADQMTALALGGTA